MKHYFFIEGPDIGYREIGPYQWLADAKDHFKRQLRVWNNGHVYTLRNADDMIVAKMRSVPYPRELRRKPRAYL